MVLRKDHSAVVLVLTLATIVAGLMAIATNFNKTPTVFFAMGMVLLFILINPLQQRILGFK